MIELARPFAHREDRIFENFDAALFAQLGNLLDGPAVGAVVGLDEVAVGKLRPAFLASGDAEDRLDLRVVGRRSSRLMGQLSPEPSISAALNSKSLRRNDCRAQNSDRPPTSRTRTQL